MTHVITTAQGTITIPDGVLEQIVRRAAESVDGAVVRRRGLSAEPERVALALNVRYGVVLPELTRAVQGAVREALRAMCALEPPVDVAIEELVEP